jgi:hypothetical protein
MLFAERRSRPTSGEVVSASDGHPGSVACVVVGRGGGWKVGVCVRDICWSSVDAERQVREGRFERHAAWRAVAYPGREPSPWEGPPDVSPAAAMFHVKRVNPRAGRSGFGSPPISRPRSPGDRRMAYRFGCFT